MVQPDGDRLCWAPKGPGLDSVAAILKFLVILSLSLSLTSEIQCPSAAPYCEPSPDGHPA